MRFFAYSVQLFLQKSIVMFPTRTISYIPYVPGDLDEEDDSATEPISDDYDDFRHYELVKGRRIPRHHRLRIVYENGITQGEGTYLHGYREGIWRFFTKSGVLSCIGRYNKHNQRWGKWRSYEELNGRACIRQIVEHRKDVEEFWSFDMDGELCLNFEIHNINAPVKEHVYLTKLQISTHQPWPRDF